MKKHFLSCIVILLGSINICAGDYLNYLMAGPDLKQIDKNGQHRILVCAANLEYYLATEAAWRTGYGPRNSWQHSIQKEKVCSALSVINADLYGLVEIEGGGVAANEICTELNRRRPDRHYKFINNGTSSGSSFTTCIYVYDANVIAPHGDYLGSSDSEVQNRKYIKTFREVATGEKFNFSINHFKSKTGDGGDDRRNHEAQAVNTLSKQSAVMDPDVIIMGDLNSYWNESPISILLENDGKDLRTDLLQKFLDDTTRYSYYYSGYNYLDHAIVNSTMLPQVTGIQAFHCNSKYTDGQYGYPTGEKSIRRYSDHDPIIVGLRLNGTHVDPSGLSISELGSDLIISSNKEGFVRIYDYCGNFIYQQQLSEATVITTDNLEKAFASALRPGVYIYHIFYDGKVRTYKFIKH